METINDLIIEDSTARCLGNWTAPRLHEIERRLARADWPPGDVQFKLGGMEKLDTAGAWLLHRTISGLRSEGREVLLTGANEQAQHLLELVARRSGNVDKPPGPDVPGLLESAGRHATSQLQEYLEFLNFVGRLAAVSGQALLRPWCIRWAVVVRELQAAGVNALPIVGLLTFLIGIVIAYQGGVVLVDYGANIYVADIVGLSMVRELAPLITAIIVAGRTGSAYTAQIGTMMVTEEVDALRSIGISPLEMLVLPKLVALLIALPLLTVFADAMGLLGGLIMANSMLSLNPATFISRLAEALTLDSYLSGIGKAPVFAAIIAAVGCFQGFRVYGSAGSVGRQTTISVVQSIFLVIIVDAAFSVAFAKLGI
ncbi:MAG TPA: MlaE family lipid ABC transporter permease subunit [Xanthomonadales bacterium]|nr:MlaE family lipid ABC transporter permease subunit [Xanthomonadales bacterium]